MLHRLQPGGEGGRPETNMQRQEREQKYQETAVRGREMGTHFYETSSKRRETDKADKVARKKPRHDEAVGGKDEVRQDGPQQDQAHIEGGAAGGQIRQGRRDPSKTKSMLR